MTDKSWEPIGDILNAAQRQNKPKHPHIEAETKLSELYGDDYGTILAFVYDWAITSHGLFCLTTPYDIPAWRIGENQWWQSLCSNRAFEPAQATEALATAREVLSVPRPIITPYFNRPAEADDGVWARSRDKTIEDMIVEDIGKARDRLWVASAWFTSEPIAQAILDSRCPLRVVLLNRTDLERGEKAAVKRLFESVGPGGTTDYGDNKPPEHALTVGVLGAVKHFDGIMHHKWVVADDVVWVGSYNLTKAASNNYETMVRILDQKTADRFAGEAKDLYGQVSPHRTRVSVNYCAGCGKYFPYYMVAYVDSHDGPVCYDCAKQWS